MIDQNETKICLRNAAKIVARLKMNKLIKKIIRIFFLFWICFIPFTIMLSRQSITQLTGCLIFVASSSDPTGFLSVLLLFESIVTDSKPVGSDDVVAWAWIYWNALTRVIFNRNTCRYHAHTLSTSKIQFQLPCSIHFIKKVLDRPI